MEDQNIVVTHTEKGGIGWLAFALIPAALAGAGLMWLAFYTGVIDWSKTQRIEGRMDARVGVNGQLTAPVDLIIRKTSCLKVSRAFLDSGSLTAYVTNSCTELQDSSWALKWNAIAPDGTIISSSIDQIHGGTLEAGETKEMTEDVSNDSRMTKFVVWAQKYPY